MHPGRGSLTGRDNWSWAPCLILLLSVALPQATAMYQGNGQRDTVHRVYKVKVTEDVGVRSDDSQVLAKREGNACPASYSLCVSSLGGNCCPDNYACAQSSCYATTAAPSTCGGTVGAFACPLSLNGGCCPQGLVCGSLECLTPAGATYTQTCPGGYSACPASLAGGCCASGMGCAISSCYTLSPLTTALTYTTTEDGSAVTITTTSVTTPTLTDLGSATGNTVVVKFYPSTVSKTEATTSAAVSSGGGSGSSGGGLSKGAIGGIVAAAVLILLAVVAAAIFIIKRLNHTARVVQTHRETTSGTHTRQTEDKKSSVVNVVRVIPTPSEVDAFDYDPLMMNSSVASPLRPGQRPQAPRETRETRPRGGSDAGSSPSLWSGQSVSRWNSPSMNEEGDDRGRTTYFELPPQAHQRQSVNSNDSSPFSYHDYTQGHGRQFSNASELSTGSDDHGAQRGARAPLMPIELGVEGGFRPELPGSDTETESNGGGPRRQPRRKGTAGSINDIVSPMSVRPGVTRPSRPRRRNDSMVSPMDGQAAAGDGAASILGSIDESVGVRTSHSLHGHYGPDVGDVEVDQRSDATIPGFVSLGRPSHDESERR